MKRLDFRGMALLRGMALIAATGLAASPLVADTINVMKISSEITAPGSFASAKVLLSHDGLPGAQGFQTAMIYDNSVLTLNMVDTAGLDVEILLLPESVEFFTSNIVPAIQPGIGWGSSVAIFDFGSPFNGQLLPPGTDQSIVAYHLSAINDPGLIGTCTTLSLVDGLGSPPISNVFTVGGLSVMPKLVPGTVCFQGLPIFRRGDGNTDGIVNVADVIFCIQFLFVGGTLPNCDDSADANNDQLLDVSDAIWLINYLFVSGAPPPTPFPNCGTESGGDTSISCSVYGPCP